MARQTRSTTKAAAASSRPERAVVTAASARPKRVAPGPSSQLPQHVTVGVAKPKVRRTKEQQINEKTRKRGRTFYTKGEQLANQCKIPVVALYRDRKLGWDGFVCPRGLSWQDLADIMRRVHERGPLERRRGRRKKTHLQDLVEVHVHDDVVSIEANDDQGENDDQEDNDGVGNIDDEHTADADANDHHGESDDANGNGSDAHATENRGVGRNIYSLDPESPLGPLGRPQASEPGSDVPALEPTGNSSPQRSMSPEVDAALQAPRTPLPAVDDFSYEWLPLPTDPFEENANGDLDEFLYRQQLEQANVSVTGQACFTASGRATVIQRRPYPAKSSFARRPRLDPGKEALIAEKMRVMRLETESVRDLIDKVVRGYSTAA